MGSLKILSMLAYNLAFRTALGIIFGSYEIKDRLCGLVVRNPGYTSRGPGFDSWSYQIF
jgi:hypothetical protein